MGFAVDTGLTAAAAFAQGLLSFFSPCVLPLLPLYPGYLSGGAIVILFGLYRLGVFGGSALPSGEKRIPLRFGRMAMSPGM